MLYLNGFELGPGFNWDIMYMHLLMRAIASRISSHFPFLGFFIPYIFHSLHFPTPAIVQMIYCIFHSLHFLYPAK